MSRYGLTDGAIWTSFLESGQCRSWQIAPDQQIGVYRMLLAASSIDAIAR